jgi:hypothetical protein
MGCAMKLMQMLQEVVLGRKEILLAYSILVIVLGMFCMSRSVSGATQMAMVRLGRRELGT